MENIFQNEFASPPSWSLAIGVIGRMLVLVGAGLFALAGASWAFSKGSPAWAKVGKYSFNAACWSVIGAFASLGLLFATNRFEYEYVFGHADSQSALAYRIAGIWSGQEGSFLLWATASSLFALITVARTGKYRRWYSVAFCFFLGGIASILAFESPFNLNMFNGSPVVPENGVGLAPSLQNYWVIIHPPTIFLGFGSLTALFALAFSALVEKDYSSWIPIVRPWAIVSTTLVGLGLCMGGFWAYETLGWGGFWMWDPVENVSFVPWCFTIALIHGVIVQATRKKWQMTNLLFGALPFMAFIYGTFLTRSGVLAETSVHSFAEMDRSALKLLLVLLGGTTLGFTGLWAVRAYQGRKQKQVEEGAVGLRREGFYMLGIAAMLALGVTTLIGMSVPMVLALQGKEVAVVEERLYHQVLPWIFIPIMLLMAVAPFVSWNGMRGRELASRAYTILCITVGLTGLMLFLTVVTPLKQNVDLYPTVTMLGRFQVPGLAWMMVLVGVCVFVIVGNAWRIADLAKRSKLGLAPFFAHVGVAILLAGLIVSRGFEQKDRSFVMEDHPGRLLSYEVRYAGMTLDESDRNNEIKLDVYEAGGGRKPLFTATPGLYNVTASDGHVDTMVWPHIEHGPLMDTYISLGSPQKNMGQDVTVAFGEAVAVGNMTITYEDVVRNGEMGMEGGSIGALLTIEEGGETRTVSPSISFDASGNFTSHPADIDESSQLALLSMNSDDRSVVLRLQLSTVIYPVEIYHKPMTMLVWLGSGLLTLAGFASAVYRRSTVPVEQATDDRPRPSRLTTEPSRPTAIGETT
jgi:cytochrome c-type biogenesis protein CcmF